MGSGDIYSNCSKSLYGQLNVYNTHIKAGETQTYGTRCYPPQWGLPVLPRSGAGNGAGNDGNDGAGRKEETVGVALTHYVRDVQRLERIGATTRITFGATAPGAGGGGGGGGGGGVDLEKTGEVVEMTGTEKDAEVVVSTPGGDVSDNLSIAAVVRRSRVWNIIVTCILQRFDYGTFVGVLGLF